MANYGFLVEWVVFYVSTWFILFLAVVGGNHNAMNLLRVEVWLGFLVVMLLHDIDSYEVARDTKGVKLINYLTMLLMCAVFFNMAWEGYFITAIVAFASLVLFRYFHQEVVDRLE